VSSQRQYDDRAEDDDDRYQDAKELRKSRRECESDGVLIP
jgi:hypothetical protein